jgi:hypothetical protein
MRILVGCPPGTLGGEACGRKKVPPAVKWDSQRSSLVFKVKNAGVQNLMILINEITVMHMEKRVEATHQPRLRR